MTLDLTKPENLAGLRKALAREIAAQVRVCIAAAQKRVGADYLGFGTVLARRDLKLYERLNWEEVFPEVPVVVKAICRISRIGLAQ